MAMFILGILVSSLCATIFYLIYEAVSPMYDIDFVVFVVSGPIFWGAVLGFKVFEKIRKFIRRKKRENEQKKSS